MNPGTCSPSTLHPRGLSSDYHALFDDWWTAASWHGGVVAALLTTRGVVPPSSVLDRTCGIGTQALPLAAIGYRVTGTDISRASVARARIQAQARQLQVELEVADVRALHKTIHERLDALISCDNSLPHLPTDADLQVALAGIRRRLRHDGVFLASVRDYDALAAATAVGANSRPWRPSERTPDPTAARRGRPCRIREP